MRECQAPMTARTRTRRRALLGAAVALAGTLLMPLGAYAKPTAAVDEGTTMTVHRDPNCGCCGQWMALAAKAGFKVKDVKDRDLMARKLALGVPETLASCHTATVGGYVIEGHVPLADVARLLRDKPKGVAGIAVPGMPAGSPGMEMPDGSSEPFAVIAFERGGTSRVFAQHR